MLVTCIDHEGYRNAGLAGWNDKERRLAFVGIKIDVIKRDEMEGVNEDDSKCFWLCGSLEVFVAMLAGDVRRIMREHAKKALDSEQ